MKLTVLIDNIASGELAGEWGLAIYIEQAGKKILLDAGGSGRFIENAARLGIDLSAVDFGVLSHAHYDHSLGLDDFFAINHRAKFYIRQGTGENCYHYSPTEKRYIGLRKGCLAEHAGRLVFVGGDYELFPGAMLIPHRTEGIEKISERNFMYIERDGKLMPDAFGHEQSLVIGTEKGLVIFSSCSHAGADNIVKEISRTYPGKNIYAIIGGFHQFNSPADEVRAFARRLKETGVQYVVTGHCTGDEAYAIIREELGDRAQQIYSGFSLEI